MMGQFDKDGGGGRIINIASISGRGYAGASNAAYAASKGAVIALTKMAAQQLGRYNINVNAICPGVTRTELGARNAVTRAAIHPDHALCARVFTRARITPTNQPDNDRDVRGRDQRQINPEAQILRHRLFALGPRRDPDLHDSRALQGVHQGHEFLHRQFAVRPNHDGHFRICAFRFRQ